MKTKFILISVLAATVGITAGWFAPHPSAATTAASADRKILYYACPMHPNIKYDHPGDCPICGMKLQPVYADNTNTNSNIQAAPVSGCCSANTNP